VEYKIVYSDRKTVSIRVDKDGVTVKAPIGVDKKTRAQIVLKHSAWIEKSLASEQKKQERERALSPDEVKILKKLAKSYFTEKTEYYSQIMGLKYGRITITSAQKRFGSCSSAGNISYSYRLMLYPEAAREYVVVHELAHLVEMNHSKRFYEIIAKILPDYKYRKKLLK
jgi:predicted metal-dependent hydrolase